MYATRDAVRIWHEMAGEEGPPVILIMGFTMPGAVWHRQVRLLADRCRLLTFDHAGVGLSDANPRASMAAMAQDVLALLDHQGWETAHVVGVSMGGMVAQHVVAAAPSRVRSLTLIATHPGGLPFVCPTLCGLALFLGANLVPASSRDAVIERLLFPGEYRRAQPSRVRAIVRDDLTPATARATRMAHLRAVIGHRVPTPWRAAGFPTLIVRPGADLLVRAEGSDVLARTISGAKMVRVEDAGHGILHQCPERVADLLWDHLRKADGAWPDAAEGRRTSLGT